jgi:hypothetical protein
MRSMPELMLIQETLERASVHLQSMLTLVQLSFDEGAAVAKQIALTERRTIDPEASAYFGEARQLLLRPVPNLSFALIAMGVAASREPDCYGLTHVAIQALVLQAARDTAAAELAAAAEQELPFELELQKRS